jgi:ParB-like chromosome segregation protein Spo0J
MDASDEWQNPITERPGRVQSGVDPNQLRPSRDDLILGRLNMQRHLLRSRRQRLTPIVVSEDGVIINGHHAVRAAAEEGQTVDVVVRDFPVVARGVSVLDLPLR